MVGTGALAVMNPIYLLFKIVILATITKNGLKPVPLNYAISLLLDDPQWNANNLPVVGVLWFEAEAYCNGFPLSLWKTIVYPQRLNGESCPRSDGKLWAWGNTWVAVNMQHSDGSLEDKLNRTSPVGMYPQGKSPYRVEIS